MRGRLYLNRRDRTSARRCSRRGCTRRASTSRGWCGWPRDLAASHIAVVTPDIPELSRFEIAPAITDAIEDAGDLARVGRGAGAGSAASALMGISFSGGLSIVAAGRPSLADRVAYVFSLGGHDDLTRVMRYLCTGHELRPTPIGATGRASRTTTRSCSRRTTTASR